MRQLTPQESTLVTIAQQYNSPDELKQKAFSSYTIMKRKNLLKAVWPEHTCALPPDYLNPETLKLLKLSTTSMINNIVSIVDKAGHKVANVSSTSEVEQILADLRKQLRKELW